MWTEFVYGLGDLLSESFKILPILGNSFNAVLAVTGFAMCFWWIRQMARYNKKAKREGTLK